MSRLLELVEILPARRRSDDRGWLQVALTSSQLPPDQRFGELYAVHSNQAEVRRGDHFHRKADEWFCVVAGSARLELKDPTTGDNRSILLSEVEPCTVRVPAGLAHCLVSTSGNGMTALAWSTAEHDEQDVIQCPTSGPQD